MQIQNSSINSTEKELEFRAAILRKKRRDDGKKDIEYFAGYYLGHILENKTPDFHVEIRKLLFKHKRLGLAAPRGFAKSTNVQVIYAIYCLLYNDKEDILSISQSADMAEDWVRKIKFELEGNERIREDFGPILQWGEKESKRWTASHLVIQDKKGNIFSQIRARGRGCQVRGLRPTKVFCDDLEDEELVRSEEQRRFLQEWFLGALLNVLKNDQQLVVIGTILHPLSLIANIINKKDSFSSWNTKKYVALKDNTSLWPDRFPVEDLLRRKKEIGTYAFEAEFQNNPIASGVCLWKPEWIRRYTRELRPEDIKIKFAALDPAESEDKASDYSSMTCIGVGYDGNVYELETIRGHWGTWDLIDKIITFYVKWRPIRFGIEEVAFQSFIKPVLIKESRDLKIVIPVESLSLGKWTGKEKEKKMPRDKYTRALSVVHYWEQGMVYMKSPDLVDEISMFPTGSNDDQVDSMVWAMKMMMKHAPIKVMIKGDERLHKTGSFRVQEGGGVAPFVTLDDMINQNKDGNWKIG